MRALVPAQPAPSVRIADTAPVTPGTDAEVLVAVEAVSINRGETFQLERPAAGWRPGKDVAGRVVRAAADGSGPPIGSRVVAHVDAAGWAEQVVVPPDRLAALPDDVDATTAAALPLAGLTALRLLRACGPVAARRVLLTGASGGVGHYFVELAAAQGADVTVVVGSPGRAERLLELGARRAVAAVEAADGPFDVGLDSVGGDATDAVLHRLTEHGRLVWFGQAGRTPPTLDFLDWSGGANATIRKFHYADPRWPVAADLAALVRLTSAQRLHPEIGLVDDWRHANAAIRALLGRRVRGNAVLTLDPLHPPEGSTRT